MDKRLVSLEVENFRSLRKIHLHLGDLTVLVGPNGAGKTNVLKVFDFLADIIRTDLEPALDARGGFDEVVFHGGDKPPSSIRIKATATWTTHSSRNAPDEYELRITRSRRSSGDVLSRRETFQFKRTQGRGRRITISGQQATVVGTGGAEDTEGSIGIKSLSSGLSTLPRLHGEAGGEEVSAVADRLASFRVFDVAVPAARRPVRVPRHREYLEDDASNLASFLLMLRRSDPTSFERLQEDARQALPQLESIDFEHFTSGTREVAVVLHERGLRRPTPLVDASYGTVRLLGLLALLYDPQPPALTCVEEIDHGLHPQALEMLVERLREASERSQYLIATHSPALADRLRPEEFVVCERREDGSSAIPAVSTADIRRIVQASDDLPLGELWFSGALGGDL
ncbi:AAA family ATPase [Saccharothrix coeruleofusca]|uniref:Chromosome segregation protein SMC n=1 Tax=Saccharothrix coeruleofusca TaxID=33919 RepID=A0A918AIH7_9PSEU|nr:AAA family ATPase [Saccharothrix coeruleofusca]GGP42484.1 chromosome segregation protein SMC [Saccharothrix coeruleofusca]